MSYNLHSMAAFLRAFGLTTKSKLPVAGAEPRLVDGYKVWINPLVGEAPRGMWGRPFKRSTHRFMCECPYCGVTLSVARLNQHVCTRVSVRCDVCSRRYRHTHCPECGDCNHVASDCDMLG